MVFSYEGENRGYGKNPLIVGFFEYSDKKGFLTMNEQPDNIRKKRHPSCPGRLGRLGISHDRGGSPTRSGFAGDDRNSDYRCQHSLSLTIRNSFLSPCPESSAKSQLRPAAKILWNNKKSTALLSYKGLILNRTAWGNPRRDQRSLGMTDSARHLKVGWV